MKTIQILIVSVILLLVAVPSVFAEDFGWTRDFNIQAQADPSGFRARLATRFNIGALQGNAVLGNFEDPSDAYIALRLGEMCGKPVDYVIDRYKADKAKGWGRLAKSLGIKPGSKEFHALKEGHDLDGVDSRDSHNGRDHNKGKEKKNKDSEKGKKKGK